MGEVSRPGLSPLFSWRSAICDSDLPATARHVALTLSLHMNERGGSCFPSADTLARESGLSERSVRTHRNLLVEKGWLILTEQGGIRGTKRRANAYAATFPNRKEVPVAGSPESPDPGSSCTHRVQEVPVMGAGDAPQGVIESVIESDISKPPSKKGSRIQTPFVVTQEMKDWVKVECAHIDWRLQTRMFVDWAQYTSGPAGVKRDWIRAWKNWMRRAESQVPAFVKDRPTR